MSSKEIGYTTLASQAGDKLLTPIELYANSRTVLDFLCINCNSPYHTTAFLWKKSDDGKRCFACKKKMQVNCSDARAEFIRRATEIHGGYYDYSLLPATFKAKDAIIIVCPKHGQITTTGDSHVGNKAGCNVCKIDKITSHTRSNAGEFAIKANSVHEFKYNYDCVTYINAVTPVTIQCVKHGLFSVTPDVHLRGAGCPTCATSKPVQAIMKRLLQENIRVVREKTFAECVAPSGRLLRFDLYLPDYNLLVEYDGPHHFAPTIYGTMTSESAEVAFNQQLERDEIKNRFCEEHSIELIRIPHTIHHPDAYLMKILNNQINKVRYVHTFDMLAEDVKNICSYIKSFGYERFAVYGIARGGVMFSIPVSYHFDGVAEYGVVTFQRYDGNDKNVQFDIQHETKDIPIFVIDDLISSGATMNKVLRALAHKYKKATIHPIVVFGEENADGVFFLREHPKQWIVFDYEV